MRSPNMIPPSRGIGLLRVSKRCREIEHVPAPIIVAFTVDGAVPRLRYRQFFALL